MIDRTVAESTPHFPEPVSARRHRAAMDPVTRIQPAGRPAIRVRVRPATRLERERDGAVPAEAQGSRRHREPRPHDGRSIPIDRIGGSEGS